MITQSDSTIQGKKPMFDKLIILSTGKFFLILGATLSFLGVAIGAFGAHALKQKISPEMLSILEVGVRYQMYHAIALIAVGILIIIFPATYFSLAGWLLLLGTTLFSGSLYILALTQIRAWGAISPIGGLLFLCGWLAFLWTIIKISEHG
jgi:uncharacterized membrane protein YgdD (TMEM256/DUF423 family)